jgi:hypothetical protein
MHGKPMHVNSLCSYSYLNYQKPLFLPIIAYTLSSTKLERRAKQFLLGIEGVGGRGRGKGGEMTQTLYAHMNKIKIKKKKELLSVFRVFISFIYKILTYI